MGLFSKLASLPVSLAGKIGGQVNNLLGTTDAMNQQNRQQWDMWNAQNAYNTPPLRCSV